MDKNSILSILNDWNFWSKNLDTGVKRDFYLKKLKKFLNSNHTIVITGARKSGKSFIMKQLARELIKEGVDKKNILIVNFNDPRFDYLDANILQQIYETYLEFLSPDNTPYIFLDEVQEVREWEKWAITMHELGKAKIVVSGSNAKLLSQELSTLLTGQHLDLTVFPLSFREFLKFNNISFKNRLDIVSQRINIQSLARQYIESGGFPEVVLGENKKEILLTYFNDILNKDLVWRYKVRKSEKLKSLIKFYMSNTSSLTTFRSMGKFLEIPHDTIKQFSGYFTNAFLIFFLKRFSFKTREQDKSPRKIYTIDGGLSNAVGFSFSENLGKLAENIVFLELQRKKISNPDLEIYYWKNERHQEVDFVVKNKNNITELIQVCWDLSNIKTKKREIGSLLKATEALSIKEGLIITSDFNGEENIKGKRIKFIPLWEWLLSK